MSNQRSKIRDAVAAILTAASTDAGPRVYADRVDPLFGEAYPLILVYAREEQSRSQGSTPRPMQRLLALSIEIRTTAAAGESLDTLLDTLCDQVETAIVVNPRLNQTVMSCNLTSTEFDVSASGEEVLGGARLNYEVAYVE